MRAALNTLFLALSLSATAAYLAEAPYDLVLRNARIVDGTGNPWFRADLAVRGDTIVNIAPLSQLAGGGYNQTPVIRIHIRE